jgi:hypothetical protein
MTKARIVKRTHVDGRVTYVIQQRHWPFFWWWCDAWINALEGAACKDWFSTLEEAEKNLCYFDGSKRKDEVVLVKGAKNA